MAWPPWRGLENCLCRLCYGDDGFFYGDVADLCRQQIQTSRHCRIFQTTHETLDAAVRVSVPVRFRLQGGGDDLKKKDGEKNSAPSVSDGQQIDLTANKFSAEASKKTVDLNAAKKATEDAELENLKKMKEQLQKSIEKNEALSKYKDQILVDITKDGLRIQVIDRKNRPMFATGSDRLESYTQEILAEVAQVLKKMPIKISIVGHTDAAPYINSGGMSNWELSINVRIRRVVSF